MYERLQNLLKLVVGKSYYENELTRILDFYGEDFIEEKLRSQLKIFSANFPAKEELIFQDIIIFFKNMNPGLRALMTEVCKVMELIQVLPATTASPERSFSRSKLIKTPLRSTMTLIVPSFKKSGGFLMYFCCKTQQKCYRCSLIKVS